MFSFHIIPSECFKTYFSRTIAWFLMKVLYMLFPKKWSLWKKAPSVFTPSTF